MLRFPFNHFLSSVRFSPLSYIAYISQINYHGCQEPQMCAESKKTERKGLHATTQELVSDTHKSVTVSVTVQEGSMHGVPTCFVELFARLYL